MDFNPAPEVRRSFAIAKASQTISFNAIPDKVFGDEDFDITATTSAGLSVSFSVITGPASVNGNTVELTGAGTVTIAANQFGNVNYNGASQVLRSFEVAKAGQVVTIEPISEKTTLSNPFDVVATVASGLPLTYTVTGPAVVSGATITLSGTPGEVVVTASQAGDDDYNAASASVSFTVVQGLLPQSISFDAIDDQVYGGVVVLDAVADSGLPVVYELMTGNLALDGNMLSFSGVGFAAIKAVQAGNNEYQAAEVVREFMIERAALSLVADDLSREYGQDNPELTFSADGLVYGETVDEALSGLPAIMTPASEVSIPGTYVISLTGAEAANYQLDTENGELVITKAELTVTANDAERVIGGATPVFSLVYDGFVNGQDETSLPTAPVARSEASSVSGIGEYAITPEGGSSPLYNFNYVDGTLTIVGAVVSGMVNPATPLGQGNAVLHQQLGDGSFIEVGQAAVNLDGSFSIDNVDAGAHTIEVVPGGSDLDLYFTTFLGGANLLGNAATFDMALQAPTSLVVTMVSKPATQGNGGDNDVNGVLTNNLNTSGGRVEEGTPIANTEVWLVDATGNIVGTDITDAAGNYSFVNLVAGSYTLQLNYNGQLLDFSGATINVEDGQGTVNLSSTINADGLVISSPMVLTALQLPQIVWSIYPNPATEYLTISIDGPGAWDLQLHNLNGQLMLQSVVGNQAKLQLGHLPKGIYLLLLSDQAGQRRLIKRIRLE
ncbi:MAG: MBG domain-containing protein [Bacteroidota bacterium]